MSRKATAENMPGIITEADIDLVLAKLPASEIEVASLVRYGDSPWECILKVRKGLEELKAKISA